MFVITKGRIKSDLYGNFTPKDSTIFSIEIDEGRHTTTSVHLLDDSGIHRFTLAPDEFKDNLRTGALTIINSN